MFNGIETPEQHLSKVTCDIMREDRYTHLAGILMIGSREVSDDVPTACTNGRDEKYGREFIKNMSSAELKFLVLHENYHKMYKHLTTWKHLCAKDPQLANMAMDYNINGKICDENKDTTSVSVPLVGGWIPPRYSIYFMRRKNKVTVVVTATATVTVIP